MHDTSCPHHHYWFNHKQFHCMKNCTCFTEKGQKSQIYRKSSHPEISHIQWNVSITKSCGWRNYIRKNEISLHWNTLKISHRCSHRRFSRAAAIESNKSRGPLCAHLHWLIQVARSLNSWPNPELKMFPLSLVISIPFNRNCDERAGECGYVP
jgi:hypothetical protein